MSDTPSAKARHVLEVNGVVDCPAKHLQAIADAERINVLFRSIEDVPDFGGQLIYKDKKAGILINTCIPNSGKHNFTFAHELGHYFLRHIPAYIMDDKLGFHCMEIDMGNPRDPQETEANRFAAELLMPKEQFRLAMIGSTLDYTLINNLARQFRVSKYACCNRLLEFTRNPYIVIRFKNFDITEMRASKAARPYMKSLEKIPAGSGAYDAITAEKNQNSFHEGIAKQWITNVNPSIHLYEWTRGAWTNGVGMTILRW